MQKLMSTVYAINMGRALQTFFAALPGYFRADFMWWTLLLPLAVALSVYVMSGADIMGWGRQGEVKDLMEVLHPSVLGFGLASAVTAWALTRDRALLLLAAVCLFCLGRELAGQGSSVILILGLFLCIWYADGHRLELESFLASHVPRSLVALCFVSYGASQVLDRGILKHSGRLVLGDSEWNIRFSSNMEESLETFGGLCLLMAVLALWKRIRKAAKETPDI